MVSAKNEPDENYPLRPAVAAFNTLSGSDQLAALALIYKQVASSIQGNVGTSSSKVSELVKKVEESPQERILATLGDILTAGKNDEGEEVLDPNPSKALSELVTGGGTTIPTDEYNSLDTESKLDFWYQMAQKFAGSIPSDFSPSSQVTDLVNTFNSLEKEQQMALLKRVV